MRYAFMGKTGVRVSRVAMGTMAFGPDPAMDAAIFAACRDAGVNVFDCADVYQGGRSEAVLGDLVRTCRDEVIITSKAYFPTGEGPNDRGTSRYHLVRAVEASLRRLKTDRIDVFFLHRFDDRTDLAETLRAVELLVQQGKILYPAVSNFAAWQVQKALGMQVVHNLSGIVAVQPMYNLVKRQAEVEILPMAMANDLAVFPYSPLGGGLLSGKYGPDKRPSSGRLLDVAMYAVRYGHPSNFEVAGEFCRLADEVGVHPVTLAIAWVGSHPGVTAPLVGARDLEQLAPVLAAGSYVMEPDVRERISALSMEPPPATDRNEERSAHNFGAR